MRYDKTRKFLIFWCLFIGIGAIYGSSCMLIDPSGKLLQMDKLLPYFKVLPFSNILFQDYIFSGISLLIVNGFTNMSAAILLLKKKELGITLGTIFGFTLMLWITIQFIIFPFNILSTTYFIFGFIQLITGIMCHIFYKQETFHFDINQYKEIQKESDTLVVYFSRMGYVKKIAYNLANQNKAEIYELLTNEKVSGTSGFWWCGRYGMKGLEMSLKNNNKDLSKYKKIIICSPIWVFDICSPIKTFIRTNLKYLENCDLVIVHFNKMKYNYVFNNLSSKYNLNIDKKVSVCSRIGKILYQKQLK